MCESKKGKGTGVGGERLRPRGGFYTYEGRAGRKEYWVEGATDRSTALRKSQQMERVRIKFSCKRCPMLG